MTVFQRQRILDHRSIPSVILLLLVVVVVVAQSSIRGSSQEPIIDVRSAEIPSLPHGGIHAASFSRDGTFCATAGDDGIRLWNTKDSTRRGEVVVHQVPIKLGWAKRTRVTGIEFANGNKLLVTGGEDGNITIFEIPELRLLKAVAEPLVYCCGKPREWWSWSRLPISRLAISPDGKTIARAIAGNIRLWNADSGGTVAQFGEQFTIEEVPIDELVPEEYRSRANEWKGRYTRDWLNFPEDVATRTSHMSHPKSTSSHLEIWSLAFSPDGKVLVYSDQEKTYVWEWRAKKLIHMFPVARYSCFSPDSSTIASCNRWGPIVIRDVLTGRDKLRINTGAVGIAFSADGESLFACKSDQICRFSIRTGAEVEVFDAITSGAYARAVIVDPTGSLLGGIWGPHTSWFRLWRL